MKLYNLCKTSRRTAGYVVALLAMLLLAYPVWRALAAGGNLDTSFSSDGRYYQYTYNQSIPVVRIQIDPNNPQTEKIIALTSIMYNGGCDGMDENYDFHVTRLNPSGTKDSNFGDGNGVKTVDFNGYGAATALELQANGKILIAGNLTVGSHQVCDTSNPGLVRLTFDGALDSTFGGNGKVLAPGTGRVSDMVVQADGKIILVGKAWQYSRAANKEIWYSAIWRFNANGTPDTTFGGDGLKTVQILGELDNIAEGFDSVFVQSDGKIVVLSATFGYRLRRFTSTGAVDNTLNVNAPGNKLGKTVKGVGTKIWVVGSETPPFGPAGPLTHGAIFSHNADGSPDTAFGGGTGKVVSAQPSLWTDVSTVPLSLPSKYVVVGNNSANSTSPKGKGLVMRYYANGTLDTSFGTNGSTETAFFYNGGRGEMADYVRYDSVHVGLSSKIVVSGWGGFYAGNPNPNFALIARYWGN